MRPTQRGTGTSVIAGLLAAPQAFEFVQAVTILLRWLEEQGVAPERALRDHLRFENSLHLGFPPSEIEALRRTRVAPDMAPAGPPAAAPDAEADAAPAGVQGLPEEASEPEDPAAWQFRLTPTFMGLLGAHGTLPAHYTERVGQWQHDWRDEAPRAFLDMLSGRMLSLYYEAWRKYRIEYAAAAREDGFRACLLALAGVPGGNKERDGVASGVPEALLASFAGLLQQRPRSAAMLERLLAGYFGLRVKVEEAVGHWSRMAAHEQSALGAGASLGENAMLGERSWRPDLRARLRIGPVGRDAFERFLPSGDMAAALRGILAAFAVPGVDFEVQLVLRADEVGYSRLSGAPAIGTRLGRDSFLVTAPVRSDRADMRYLLRPMAPLPKLSPAPARAPRGASA